jgi:hypothetical protein
VVVQRRQRLLPWPWLLLHCWHLVDDDVDVAAAAAVVAVDDAAAVAANNTDDTVDEPVLPRLPLVLALVVAADVAAAIPCLDCDVRVCAGSHFPQLIDVVAGAGDADGVAEVGVAGAADVAVAVYVVGVDAPLDVALAVVVVEVVALLLLLVVPLLLWQRVVEVLAAPFAF